QYIMGRGIGCVHDYSRSLEQGYLPILIERIKDKSITYETKVFVSLERSPLIEANNQGTDFLIADRFGAGAYLTESQKAEADQRWQNWQATEREETVAYLQTTITNSDPAPRYAWYKAPRPAYVGDSKTRRIPINCAFSQGFGRFSDDRVFCTVKLNDLPLSQEEIAVLVKPGETIVIDVAIPHQPVSEARARALLQQNLTERLQACRTYWENRRSEAARIEIPEKPVYEMLQAGPIHLDISTYGNQPEGTLTPTIGVYSALGSESWPIILYFDSIGLHDKARRCIQYFYDKQHNNGFMRNFGSYMLETGAVLWVTAEHYAYTRDDDWLMSLMPGIHKACQYLLAWRENNKRPELKGKGYGMLEGRSSDTPDDESRMYLLNAYTYKGLAEIAKACLSLDPDCWQPILDEIALYRQDIRDSLVNNLAKGPVVPLNDGTWCPTCAPWAGGNGPVSLYTDSHNWYTHGSFVTRDSHMNTLTFCGIIDAEESLAELFMQYHCELFFHKNVRPSQPYYARHPYLHLLRGEAKAFIKNYYNALTSLADRETYSFWEHYFHASPHKTHEEGCFLMESRWMLYLEAGDTLRLLQGVPSRWLKAGQSIRLDDVASYFGHFSLTVTSKLDDGFINADIRFHDLDRIPVSVVIRLPHPEEKTVRSLSGGTLSERPDEYLIDIKQGQASLVVHY
ncbi:MAG: hypothetical protein SCM11_12030, partial [Bacillota bacterium]|nr:hypothetical protein [Bacillota bacterium]